MGRGGGEGGEGTIEVKGEGEKKKTMQVGMTEKRGGGEREEEKKKEDARSVLRTPALLNEVVPRCLRSSLKRLPPASLRC